MTTQVLGRDLRAHPVDRDSAHLGVREARSDFSEPLQESIQGEVLEVTLIWKVDLVTIPRLGLSPGVLEAVARKAIRRIHV